MADTCFGIVVSFYRVKSASINEMPSLIRLVFLLVLLKLEIILILDKKKNPFQTCQGQLL